MAYFLPSYFQKRLLRYALSRLDFIESEALDLDNLGFTIGQRSVIELKNVGIKVAKVIEKLDLPPTIIPKHASIRVLRVTIPADLHVSGIEVEVDGVNVSVDVDHTTAHDEGKRPRSRETKGPNHRDVVNRPRIATNTIHDPGGPQASTLLPTSEDLAASFLEVEPDTEKQELKAAVASRSTYLQQSNPSLDRSLSDDGTGMPEGFSLPGFVATFFAGIADRLSVTFKHIVVSLCLRIDNDQQATEDLKLILKVEEISLEGLRLPKEANATTDIRRSFRIAGVELLIACDGDTLVRKSTVSSPKLSKSRSTTSAASRSGLHDAIHPAHSSQSAKLHAHDSPPNSSTTSSQAGEFGLAMHDSLLDSSQIFDSRFPPSENASSPGSPELSRLSPTAGRDQSAQKQLSGPPSLSSSSRSDGEDTGTNDLAESKVFSHDEAESMFMSAMSNVQSSAERMPGGFDTTRSTNHGDDLADSISSQASHEDTEIADAGERMSHSVITPERPPTSTIGNENTGLDKSMPGDLNSPDQVVKRVLRINGVTLRLPTKSVPSTRSLQEQGVVHKQSDQRGRVMSGSRTTAPASHTRNDSVQSVYGIPRDQDVELEGLSCYEVTVGDVEFATDVALCHLMAKAASQASRIFDQTPTDSPLTSSSKQQDLSAKIFVQSVALNLMENMPDISSITQQRIPTESTFDLQHDEPPVLQLQILKVRLELAKQDGKLDQRLSVHRLGLNHEAEKIISFFDPSSLQESFVASSVMIEPDDLVVRQVGNRVDISVKPMHIMLDLLVLDDVLSRSGGLSSLLDLGSSIASTGTVKGERPRSAAGPIRRRSVHFNDSNAEAQPSRINEDGLKLNVRISASIIDLVGSESSMQIKSSAIKLIYRTDRLRTNISSISIRGPLVPKTPSAEIVSLRISDLELVYLDTPLEEDLDRLLSILAPSSDKYEQDDDIMFDTLLRQRRKGGVLRLSVKDLQLSTVGLAWTHRLTKLGEEISKLSTVTKYLPEDDRPGVLTFALISRLEARLEVDKQFGPLTLRTNLLEAAHISVPSLMAAQISSLNLFRGTSEPIIRELIPNMQESTIMGPHMLMCRFIADEMEPTVKLKMSNACLEYSVTLLLAVTQLGESIQAGLAQEPKPLSPRASDISTTSSEASDFARKVKLSFALRSTAVSLKPLDLPSCGLFLFTDAVLGYGTKHQTILATVEINKASIMIIDDVAKIGHEATGADPKLYFDQNDQVQELVKSGFVPVGSISAASADVKITEDKLTQKQFVDIEFRNNLLFLETCADSTQTLFQILGGLAPPAPPSKVEKYRTEQRNIVPIEDLLASFTGNAFVSEKGPQLGLQVQDDNNTPIASTQMHPATYINEPRANIEDEDDETFLNDLYISHAEDAEQGGTMESSTMSKSAKSSISGSLHIAPVNITAEDESPLAQSIMVHSLIDFRDDHFMHKTSVGGTAHRWDSTKNTYGMGSEVTVQQSPLKLRVRDVHIIWNLFDGYDWQNTRDVVTQAVRDLEDRAYEKQRRRDSRRSPASEDEDESVIGDVLFNSIYISIPTNKDPRELTNAINMELGDGVSETGSYTTSTTITAATSKRHSSSRYKPKKLRLNRSKQHKMTFELEGLAADFLVFPPDSGEVESSVDVRVRKLEIFDHIPTSTWKKFATYMHDAGEREVGTDMVHIELLNVKPVADLAASEMVMKVTVLPLRLHVDQDALDFLTRFFEFKDERIPPSTSPSNPPFLQRVEVNPVKLRLDFKPKRVDYAALKSGRTTEFMNFIVLDRADILLRRIILYGVSGFDRLGIMLNNIWTPDVRNNQLPTVLAGLAPVRSLVDVGSGVRDLIAVPIREYKKDGRIVRSIQKGAIAFAKTTTTELVNLGAKLAIGTQTALQNVEGVLAPHNQQSHHQTGFGSDSDDDDHQKVISNYADQPLGIVQGLRHAYASLERDLLLAKDAIVAVPGEIIAEGSATGAAKVVLKQSPTIILRPAIGVTKAMGQAFLGAGNTLDKQNRRRIEDKYKRY
ncbi:autophagy- protein 2 [Neophaeococcomyces mojaviensis]|uniref:Autophagy- protein 2 n=1 Tax=Neophaeococcomyces mojaviensis TaxID=3383035 RepID=A0ACC3AJN7_9EURO|nr:autophagy- protein 2 [Knufia sp. JES_112]